MQQDQSAAAGLARALRPLAGDGALPADDQGRLSRPVAGGGRRGRPRCSASIRPTRFLEPAEWPAPLAEHPRAARANAAAARRPRERRRHVRDAAMVPTVWAVGAGARHSHAGRDAQSSRRGDAGGRTPSTDAWRREAALHGRCCSTRTTSGGRCCRRSRSSTSRAPATASTTSSRSCRRPARQGARSITRCPSSRRRPTRPADAKVELFQVRLKDFEPLVSEVSRFATFTARPCRGTAGHAADRTFIRETMTRAGRPTVAIRTAPMSIVVQSDDGSSARRSSSASTADRRRGRLLDRPRALRAAAALAPAREASVRARSSRRSTPSGAAT